MNDMKPLLTLRVQPPDEHKIYQVFELHGDMDKAGLDLVKGQIDQFAQNFDCKYFVLDLSDLNYINSESIGFIMSLHTHFVKEQRSLVLVSARSNVKDVLSVIGIFSIIEYHDTLHEFTKKVA